MVSAERVPLDPPGLVDRRRLPSLSYASPRCVPHLLQGHQADRIGVDPNGLMVP